MKKRDKLRDLVLPNKKINFFISTIMVLGVISGSIFLMMLNKEDKASVVLQINTFFKNISLDKVDSGLAFKNSLIINYLFVISIWVLGLSMIGVFVNIFLTYVKGFLVGFSISAIFLAFGYKGIPASLLYVFFSQIFNMIVVMVLAIYSIMFSYNLLRIIVSKKGSHSLMLKKYLVIFMLMVMGSFFSSVLESYVFPRFLKFIIGIYV